MVGKTSVSSPAAWRSRASRGDVHAASVVSTPSGRGARVGGRQGDVEAGVEADRDHLGGDPPRPGDEVRPGIELDAGLLAQLADRARSV